MLRKQLCNIVLVYSPQMLLGDQQQTTTRLGAVPSCHFCRMTPLHVYCRIIVIGMQLAYYGAAAIKIRDYTSKDTHGRSTYTPVPDWGWILETVAGVLWLIIAAVSACGPRCTASPTSCTLQVVQQCDLRMHEATVCRLSSMACHVGALIVALCTVLQEQRTWQLALSLAVVMQVGEAGSLKVPMHVQVSLPCAAVR